MSLFDLLLFAVLRKNMIRLLLLKGDTSNCLIKNTQYVYIVTHNSYRVYLWYKRVIAHSCRKNLTHTPNLEHRFAYFYITGISSLTNND